MSGYKNYVEHPRYGRKPRVTGLNPGEDFKLGICLHWHSGRIPNTAIEADLSRQSPATVPVTHYYDLQRKCRSCQRPFIFFAEEQRYWYEELQFGLEADAVHCVECRQEHRELGRIRALYQSLSGKARADAETLEMVEAGILLIREGMFGHKCLPKLRGSLKALANLSESRQQHADDLSVQMDRLIRGPLGDQKAEGHRGAT